MFTPQNERSILIELALEIGATGMKLRLSRPRSSSLMVVKWPLHSLHTYTHLCENAPLSYFCNRFRNRDHLQKLLIVLGCRAGEQQCSMMLGSEQMGRTPTRKPTSFDIAYLAGVSQPTVSRALRGSHAVSLQTREKIQKIADELHYTVDKNASSLRSQHSNTLALLFFEDPTPDNSNINPFFLAMLGALTRQCALRGYDLLISFQQLSGDWHMKYQDSHRADGIILLGYGDYEVYRSRLTNLVEQGTHFVRWGQPGAGEPWATIGSDNRLGGKTAVQYLIERGRRHIAFIGTASSNAPEFEDRWQGYCDAHHDAGITIRRELQFDGFSSEGVGASAVENMIKRGETFDAIFAASDLIAIGAMRALNQAGLSIPGDVAVIGFDDIPSASMTAPPLTTVTQDMQLAGEVLVSTLLSRIAGEEAKSRALPVKLVIRESAG
jgi:DNA-binding LacI/PurR family transcriptional regulator